MWLFTTFQDDIRLIFCVSMSCDSTSLWSPVIAVNTAVTAATMMVSGMERESNEANAAAEKTSPKICWT